MKTKILDILAAAIIGLALAALALAYFDVLTKYGANHEQLHFASLATHQRDI